MHWCVHVSYVQLCSYPFSNFPIQLKSLNWQGRTEPVLSYDVSEPGRILVVAHLSRPPFFLFIK
jgi:hypothetical protein